MRDVVGKKQFLQLPHPAIFIFDKSGIVGFAGIDADGEQHVLHSWLQVWVEFGPLRAFHAKVFGVALSDVDGVVRCGLDSAFCQTYFKICFTC